MSKSIGRSKCVVSKFMIQMRLIDKVQVYPQLWIEGDERKSHRIRIKNQGGKKKKKKEPGGFEELT